MALDDELAQLQELEVGNVERIIENIARTELDLQEISERTSSQIKVYRSILEEKLPKMIDNIYTIADLILGIGNLNDCWTENDTNPYPKLSIGRKDKDSFLWVETNSVQLSEGDYGIRFTFENSTSDLTNICFYKISNKFNKKPVFPIKERTFLFGEETADEFSRECAKRITDGLKEKGNSRFIDLPYVLNQVPNVIGKLYEDKRTESEKRLKYIQSQTRGLGDLDVSDFP